MQRPTAFLTKDDERKWREMALERYVQHDCTKSTEDGCQTCDDFWEAAHAH